MFGRGFDLIAKHHLPYSTAVGHAQAGVGYRSVPVASGAVVAFGATLLLLAVIPVRWLEKTAEWLMANHKRRRFANRRAG
jgi:hypothetical protein